MLRFPSSSRSHLRCAKGLYAGVSLRTVFTGLSSLVLAGCGGATGDLGNVGGLDQGQQPTGTGIFRDSNVSGLDYVSGDIEGVTTRPEDTGEPGGIFRYEVGQPVTFSIGGVTLGTALLGNSFLTPANLLANANTGRRDVQNMVRFLMMLDRNNDPSDGIEISDAVRAVAQNWEQLNFGALNFDELMVPIMSDVAGADNRVPVLPSEAEAKAHIDATLRCSYSGAFGGTFSDTNAVIGSLAFIIDSRTGLLSGYTYRTATRTFSQLNGLNPLRFDGQNINSISLTGRTIPELDDFTVQFTTLDQIGGTWDSDVNNQAGTLVGARINPIQSPAYRFVARYQGDDTGVISFGITRSPSDGALSNVSGDIYSLIDGAVTFTGRLIGLTSLRTLIADAQAMNFEGELDFENLTVSGRWTGTTPDRTTITGTFEGTGCKLN
jgi:hypothetical protein